MFMVSASALGGEGHSLVVVVVFAELASGIEVEVLGEEGRDECAHAFEGRAPEAGEEIDGEGE